MKKRYLALLLCVLAAVFGVCFTACTPADPEPVAITVTQSTNDETLLEYMQSEQTDGKLSFKFSDGMVTEINGVANTTKSYWMLYTDDQAHANTTWGTYDYNGETLGSATEGAGTLVVVDGCVYVWVYTTF